MIQLVRAEKGLIWKLLESLREFLDLRVEFDPVQHDHLGLGYGYKSRLNPRLDHIGDQSITLLIEVRRIIIPRDARHSGSGACARRQPADIVR